MQGAARQVLARLSAAPGGGHATAPPCGTGPLGAPGGRRWTSVSDVLAWNARAYPERDAFVWAAREEEEEECQRRRGDGGATATAMATAFRPCAARLRDREYARGPLPLRDYQTDVVTRCHDAERDVFTSGVIEMGCGLGKSWIGAELIRRSRAPAVVLAQHTVSVEQWVELLRDRVSDRGVVPLCTARDSWTPRDAVPDVIVTTYQSLVRVARATCEHRRILRQAALQGGKAVDPHVAEHPEDHLLLLCMCQRFGVLILDEVHVAVADAFVMSGHLRASVVYGLSGSLIREDFRISRLVSTVGPVLASYAVNRPVHVAVISVPKSEYDATTPTLRPRSRAEHVHRALNPYKIHALCAVLESHEGERVIVFCDVKRAAHALCRLSCISRRNDTPVRFLLLTGDLATSTREAVLAAFAASHTGVLVCTKVCDASINFPIGCVVVQHHITSGSRQQEVQRCGRGTRDVSWTTTWMYHVPNVGTEEEAFVAHRLAHLARVNNVSVAHVRLSADVTLSDEHTHLRDATSKAFGTHAAARQNAGDVSEPPKRVGRRGRGRARGKQRCPLRP